MSNNYCTIAQFKMLFDDRVVNELSNDADSDQLNSTNLQFVLDVQASELDSVLTDRVTLGTIPLVLTKWVAISSVPRLYGRRANFPDSLQRDIEWADKFLDDIIERRVYVGSPTNSIELAASGRTDGGSRFDPGALFLDRLPTPTSTSGGTAGY